MRNATIKDIAQQAKVSKATVSRVLNNSGPVDKDTRARVEEVMQRLKYSPSTTARNLSRQDSTTIGVLIPEIENPFFGEMLKEISNVIGGNDLTMICFNSDNDPRKDEQALLTMRDFRVKGLIYTPAVDYREAARQKHITKLLRDLDAPVVLLDRKLDYLNKVDGVYFNNRLGAYQATRTLIRQGHRKLAILNAGLERVLARERQEGWLEAMKEAGLAVRDEYIFLGDYTVDTAHRLSREMLALPDPPTAVLTCNNYTSMGFLKAVREAGLHVPGDIACIGFDRLEMLEIMGEHFSYIERNTRLMGQKAIEFLIHRCAFPNRPYSEYIIDPELVIHDMS